MAGLQCPRRLWLLVHEPPLYEEPAPGSPLDIGQDIGRKAHLLFPGGVEVTEEPWEHAQAVARTSALMADATIPAIFEAAFEYDGTRIRVDVLERLASGTWGLREVKSSCCLKEHYLEDIALQACVLRGTGVVLSSVGLLHVNTTYVRGANAINWPDFFARLDVGEAVAAVLTDLPGRLPGMRECLDANKPPEVEPGSQCGSPYGCEFWDYCMAHKPDDWIFYLPRRTSAQLEELKTPALRRLPPSPLTSRSQRDRPSSARRSPLGSPS